MRNEEVFALIKEVRDNQVSQVASMARLETNQDYLKEKSEELKITISQISEEIKHIDAENRKHTIILHSHQNRMKSTEISLSELTKNVIAYQEESTENQYKDSVERIKKEKNAPSLDSWDSIKKNITWILLTLIAISTLLFAILNKNNSKEISVVKTEKLP